MEINLSELRAMHPRLPEDVALLMTVRAALGLQRNGHESPVAIGLDLERVASQGLLFWPGSDLAELDQHDHDRVTEDGAEAIALALAHRHRGWRVVRRLQREERADWLLEPSGEAMGERIALEVSGVDRGSVTARLAEKLAQVAQSTDVDQRCAGVVGFEKPVACLCSTEAARP
ncbi:MAG: hypothetical protein ACJ75H_18460 [Thermoanaerobaculia bacterium]